MRNGIIYFQPADVNDPNMPDLVRTRMENVHAFYASEMDRHGFGRKTFRIEKDVNDKIVVHTINGKHNADHYGNAPKTHIAMQPELPDEFLNYKYANIFFIGGIKHLDNGTGGVAFGGVVWGGGGLNGGYAYIPTKNMAFDIVVHEVGHTFGLGHNIHLNDPDYVMGRDAGLDGFEHYEARWLDKSSYFNPNPLPINALPIITKLHPVTREHNKITLKMDVDSPHGLHQLVISVSGYGDIAWKYVNGLPKVTVDVTFPVQELKGIRTIHCRMIDIQGALRIPKVDIVVPSRPFQKNPIEPPKETPPEPEPTPEPEVEPTPKPQPPRFVPTRGHITTSWATMKRRR